MPAEAICSACGTTFQADTQSPAPHCPRCRTAAISEQPMPAPTTSVQPGMPRGTSSPRSADTDLPDIRAPQSGGWPMSVIVVLVLIAASLAACIFLAQVCG